MLWSVNHLHSTTTIYQPARQKVIIDYGINLPVPKLNLTPPRISLWLSLSWSQTVSSRDRSHRASNDISSQVMVCSHFGHTVFRHTPVLCLAPLAFSGNRYLETINLCIYSYRYNIRQLFRSEMFF